MKTIWKQAVATLLLLVAATSLKAQDASHPKKAYYVEVYENSLLTAKSVCINYGVNAPAGKSIKLMDRNGNLVDFENALGALNYLGQQGWELVSVYERDMKGAGRRTFYLLKLDAAQGTPSPLTEAIDNLLSGK